jgi:head-tail adaptor
MYQAGASRRLISFQDVTEAVDAMGGPTQTWTQKCQLHALVEGELFEVTDSLTTGPRKETTKNMTLVVRNAASLQLNTRMRAVDSRTGEIFAITAIRYDAKKTQCFVDVVGGASKGG